VPPSIPGYEIRAPLGRGALAEVYAATDRRGRAVALKVLRETFDRTSPLAERLRHEGEILAELTHPRIVYLLDSFSLREDRTGETAVNEEVSEPGRPVLVLEEVAGKSLGAHLSQRRTLEPAVAIAVALAVVEGLAHVHECGFVHGDLKPDNILLGTRGAVKLCDFGAARRVLRPGVSPERGTSAARDARSAQRTLSGVVRPNDLGGAPAYLAPEAILGDAVDGRADLFALGVVLYQMLAGVRPFGEAVAATRDPAPRIDLRVRGLSHTLVRLVGALLERHPAARPRTAEAVARELRACLAELGDPPPPTLVEASLAGRPIAPLLTEPRSFSGGLGGAGGLGFLALGALFLAGAATIQALSGGRPRTTSTLTSEATLPLLPRDAGGLRVIAHPWAEVWVDGVLVETTPFSRPIPLAKGPHFVTLKHPEAPPVERPIEITAGQTLSLEALLPLPTAATAPPKRFDGPDGGASEAGAP
jgi:serine/threonine-protein kinase